MTYPQQPMNNQWGPPPPHAPQPPPQPKKNYTVLWIVFGVVAVLLIAAVVWVGIGFASEVTKKSGGGEAEPQVETENGGIILSEGEKNVHIYVDFLCPACKKFQESNVDSLEAAIDADSAEIIIHPMSILDEQSSTKYSSRAAAASVCAADEDKFFDYYRILLENQPAEGGSGLSDGKLVDFGTDVGLGKSFATCVKDKKYHGWASAVNKMAQDSGIVATPTILMDGAEVPVDQFAEKFKTITAG